MDFNLRADLAALTSYSWRTALLNYSETRLSTRLFFSLDFSVFSRLVNLFAVIVWNSCSLITSLSFLSGDSSVRQILRSRELRHVLDPPFSLCDTFLALFFCDVTVLSVVMRCVCRNPCLVKAASSASLPSKCLVTLRPRLLVFSSGSVSTL